jgi:histidinol-phosphate aminotransferase
MSDYEQLLRPHLRQMPPYEPILPFEVLSGQLGRPPAEIVKLDANENPYGPHPAVAQALARLPYAHIYPDPESRLLRQALAGYHQVPADNLLAGAGADELIDLIMRLFLAPGEAIINCPPTFGMYAFDADVNGAETISVRRRPDFSLDLEGIEVAVAAPAARGRRPKLLFLAAPNNPDGSLVAAADLERLLALPLIIVLDEAYVEFAGPGASRLTEVPGRNNLIVLRTFSKWAGLAGLRVGYGAFPTWLMPCLWRAKQPYNVSVAASTAALVSLNHAAELEAVGQKIVAERARLQAALLAIPWLQPYPSQANFILCRVVGRSAAAVKAALAQEGILIRYFNKPGLADHIRISVGRPQDTDPLLAALERLPEPAENEEMNHV